MREAQQTRRRCLRRPGQGGSRLSRCAVEAAGPGLNPSLSTPCAHGALLGLLCLIVCACGNRQGILHAALKKGVPIPDKDLTGAFFASVAHNHIEIVEFFVEIAEQLGFKVGGPACRQSGAASSRG